MGTSEPPSLSEDQSVASTDKEVAIILLSGGLDSATAAAIAIDEGYSLHALTFAYGQRHHIELESAKRIAVHLGVHSHRFIHLDLRSIGRSALTDQIEVPKDRNESEIVGSGSNQASNEIPVTYVPARNTIFLSYALAIAEVLQSRDIFIGVNAVDYSGYPDCRAEYIRAYEQMANLATPSGVEGKALRIHTPLIDWPKRQIIQCGLELGVDYSLTHSCYDPTASGQACGRCDACILRRRGFQDLGVIDPALG